jgi:subtilase family serine protease
MNHKYGLMVYTTTYIYIYVCIHIPPIKMNHLVVLPSSSIFNLQSHSKQPSKMIGMNSPILSRLYFIRTNTANRTASLAHFNPAGLSRWLEDSLSESFLSQWHVSDIEAMTKSGRLMPEGVEMCQMELEDWEVLIIN